MKSCSLAVLEPRLAILDETDSGLDIDALKTVAETVNKLRSPDRSFFDRDALPAAAELHQSRMSSTSLADGRIVKTGGPELGLGTRGPRPTTGCVMA